LRGRKGKNKGERQAREGRGTHTVLVVVTHLGFLGGGKASRLDGFLADISSVGFSVDAARLARLYSVLLDTGSGRVLDGSVVGSLDGVRGLDTGTILAFSDINRAGGVVVVVVYLNTSLCKVGSRRSDMDGSMLERSSSEVKKKVEEEKENRSFEIASPFQNKSRPSTGHGSCGVNNTN